VIGLFSVAVALAVVRLFLPLSLNSGWADAGLLLLAVVASITALARQLPVVNVVFASGVAAGISGVVYAVNDVTGFPFGRIEFTTAFGPRAFGVLPLAMLGLWVVAALSARGVARLVLRGLRDKPNHGYHVISLAVVLMVIFQLALNPFGSVVKGWWSQTSQLVMNIVSWSVLSLAIQVFITPLLLDKFPRQRPPNFWPFIVWMALNLILATGMFVAAQSAEALLVTAVDGIITALALRSGNVTAAPTARIT
jgi:uncharacterized membrane protein